MKRKLAVSLAALLLSILLASLMTSRPDASFLNTIYTVAGIMFSIGMGAIITFNLDRVKNKGFFLSIRGNINSVRNSFIFFFSLISICYLLYQIAPEAAMSYTYKGLTVAFSVSLFVASIIPISIVYFILNFLEIQRLNLDIAEKLLE